MKVLGIGYGRHLFSQHNFEYDRLQRCANEVESFDQIIFSKKSDELTTQTIGNFSLHATNSYSRWLMIFDAVRLGTRLIREKQIDIITCQDMFETGLVGWLLKWRFPGVTLQAQEHGDVLSSVYWRKEAFSNQIRYYFALFLLQRVDVIRVVSKRTEEFLKAKIQPGTRIHCLPVVIDAENFSKITTNRETDERKFIFITAARFVPQKNFPLMLRAFAVVHREFPGARLRIFGDGPLKTEIQVLIDKLKLSDVVSIQPWTKNLALEMSRADAYLLTSNYEGWGRVLIEAIVSRLPIVSTDVGCVGEVVVNGVHGLIVPVNNLSSLVAAMKNFVSRSPAYQEIKQHLNTHDISTLAGIDIASYAKKWAATLH